MTAAEKQTPSEAETSEGVNPAAEAERGGEESEPSTGRPMHCPRCFIVRLPPDLDERVAEYRAQLARERGRPVSLASAARRLLARGLDVSTPRRRPARPPSPQLGLFKS